MKVLALIAAALAAGCRGTMPVDMRVVVSPPAYAAAMSSTIGLGLTPITETAPGTKVRHRWTTDFGYFLSVSETTREIVNLGREAVSGDEKVFWSYDAGLQKSLEERPVSITVSAENPKNGREVSRTEMTLVWDGQFLRPKH